MSRVKRRIRMRIVRLLRSTLRRGDVLRIRHAVDYFLGAFGIISRAIAFVPHLFSAFIINLLEHGIINPCSEVSLHCINMNFPVFMERELSKFS